MASHDRVCPGCCRRLSASEFRNRGGLGSRRPLCGECYRNYYREYRERRRRERLGNFVSAVNRSRRNRATFRLVEGMARAFGGPEGLAQAWFEAIEEARQRRPGSATVMRSFQAILKLGMMVLPPRSPPQPWLQQASDEELQQALDQLVAEAIDRCLAEQFGPGDPEDASDPAAAPEGESDES